jgi:hypothetical protein
MKFDIKSSEEFHEKKIRKTRDRQENFSRIKIFERRRQIWRGE